MTGIDWREALADWDYARTVLDRLMANLAQDHDCWVWMRSRTDDGYGQISVKRAMIRTHQVAFHLFVGSIPSGLQLDHLCRNRACANPGHLEPVTSAENTRRGNREHRRYKSLLTRCPQDHPYDAANTYVHPVTGYRTCRRCRADRMRKAQVIA